MKFFAALFSFCLLAALSLTCSASETAKQGAAPVPVQATVVSPGNDAPRGTVNPGDRTCSTDADCTLVQVSCSSCCPPPTDFDAVNKLRTKDYAHMGCSVEHVRSCGVPECGLAQPEPYPEAVCHQGACQMSVHAPIPRDPPTAVPPGAGK